MSVNTVKSKAIKATQKVASLVRQARAAKADCVLVVYDKTEASIYFEGEPQAPKAR